jgi:uncharacterized protein
LHIVGGSSAADVTASVSTLDGAREQHLIRLLVILYVVAIGLSEVCAVFVDPVAGASGYALVLFAMLTHAGRLAPDANADVERLFGRNALVALAFVPVVRLVSLTAPIGAASSTGRYLLVALLLLGAVGWALYPLHLPTASLRPRSPTLQLGVVVTIVPLALLAYEAASPKQLASGDRTAQLAAAAFAVVVVACVEEIVFRGFIQTAFTQLYGPVAAPVWATLVYVITCLGVRPFPLVLFAAVLGLLFGWLVQRTGSLVGAAVGHALFNVGVFVLLPLLASSKP